MSDREKRLLIGLSVLLFVIVHVAAFKLYFKPQLESARSESKSLKSKVEQAEFSLDMEDDMMGEVDWLAKYEPQPIAPQKAESQLEQLASREAQRRGLTVKRRKPQPTLASDGLIYHRARLELEVSGREQILYQWLDRLHSPADFRAITTMTLKPKSGDDTQVDCTVTVEQWFRPPEETDA